MKIEKNNFITFIWFKTFGQMKSLQINISTLKKLFFLTFGFAILSIISFVLALYFYHANTALKSTIRDLEKGIKYTKAICYKYMSQNTNNSENPISNDYKDLKIFESGENPIKIDVNVEVDPSTASLIEISNINKSIDIQTESIKLSFHLKNSNSPNSISGFVFVIGKNDDIAEPIFVTYPSNVKLNNIFPSDYRQGEKFFIRNLKLVQARLSLKKNNVFIKEIIIYVFSASGEMLLEKLIPVEVENES